MINDKNTIIELFCVKLPLDCSSFNEEQLKGISDAFVFSQTQILYEQGFQAQVVPVLDGDGLEFAVTVTRKATPQEVQEQNLLLAEVASLTALEQLQCAISKSCH